MDQTGTSIPKERFAVNRTLENMSAMWYGQSMPSTKRNVKSAPTDDYLEQLVARTAREDPKDPAGWTDASYGGQLAVDVYQTNDSIVIRAAIAGVTAEDIDITVNDDMVTIRGVRSVEDNVPASDYLYQECYWGGFSRTIILPVTVDPEGVSAALKNGILRVVLPKQDRPGATAVAVVEEGEET